MHAISCHRCNNGQGSGLRVQGSALRGIGGQGCTVPSVLSVLGSSSTVASASRLFCVYSTLCACSPELWE